MFRYAKELEWHSHWVRIWIEIRLVFSSFVPVLFYSNKCVRAPGLCLPPHTLIVFCSYYIAFYIVKWMHYEDEKIINELCFSE